MAGDEERLIVLLEARVDRFEKELKRAERAGTSTYARMQKDAFKATTAIEAQMIASAKAQGRALDSVFGQNLERSGKSAKDAAAAFREFDKSRAAVDGLRASFDPTFAASKRYESAVQTLDRALELGILSQKDHAAALAQARAAYGIAEDGAKQLGGNLSGLGSISNGLKFQLMNTGYQVQDLAVQIAGGTSASRALSQQLPQLLSGFGLVGLAAGTLAAVGLPLVATWFGNGEGSARGFDAALSDVKNSLSAMNEQAAIYTAEGVEALKAKYGEVNAELLTFINLQTQALQRQAIADSAAAMAALSSEVSNWRGNLKVGLADLFEMEGQLYGMTTETNRMANALDRVQRARTFEDQLAAVSELRGLILQTTGGIDKMTDEQFQFFKKVQDSEDALRQMAAAAPKAGWLSGLIGQAQTLAGELWDAVKAKAALGAGGTGAGGGRGGDPRQFVDDPYWRGKYFPDPESGKPAGGSGGGSGGGGGGGGGGGSGRVDSLLRDLQTEREVVAAWYAESLETLGLATEAQLAAVGGRHEALERLEAEHLERLRGLRDGSNAGALANAETFFGALATVTAAGGDKTAKAARAFAAAEALINTIRAQAQVLADPKLGFWAKLPAVAAIGAAGMGMVRALGGGGKAATAGTSAGGSGASGGTAAGATQTQAPLRVVWEGLEPGRLFTGEYVAAMMDALSKEAGARGMILETRA